MTDKEIIQALIGRDERVTCHFFFERCRPLFVCVIRYVFSYEVDYDEFVNEFYLYLMENDAARLRAFEGRSSIFQWLKVVAIRYFVQKRDNLIEDASREPLINDASEEMDSYASAMMAKIDVEQLLSQLRNDRYAFVIKRLVLEDAEPKEIAEELNITVDNLYNIKKRAIVALTQIALNNGRVKYER